MVRLDDIEAIMHDDHAVPGAVRLEVCRVRVNDGVGLDKGAEVGDERGRPVGIDAEDTVGGAIEAVRAARPVNQGIERVAEEGDIRYPAGQPSACRVGLAGGKAVHHSGHHSARADPGDAGGEAAGVWADGEEHLLAHPDSGEAAAESAFSDVEIAVRSELEATWVVEAGGKDSHVGRALRPGGSSLSGSEGDPEQSRCDPQTQRVASHCVFLLDELTVTMLQ